MRRLLVVAAVLFSLPRAAAAVPVEWTDGAGVAHEYEMFNLWNGLNGQSWDFSRAYIWDTLGSDWDLATITSPEEQAFVAVAVVGNLMEEYWIGGYQDPGATAPDEGWMWVTGEPWEYTNWLQNETQHEPNDSGGDEHFLGLANWDGTHQWNDEHLVNNVYGFIAERTIPATAVPEPATGFLLLLGLGATAAVRCRRIRSAAPRA